MYRKLFALAGVSAMISGFLFGVIQLVHPSDELSSVGTDQWLLAHLLTIAFAFTAIPGLVGLYLKQAPQVGWWGFTGFVLLLSGFALMLCFGFFEAFVAPGLVHDSPEYVASALSILDGEAGPQYLGTVYQINGALYMVGGLIFGITTLRAKVFPRWATSVLLLGLALTLSVAVISVLARPSAIVFGLGFAALGYHLTRRPATA